MIVSPCISICKTDPSSGYCYGCGRNNEEKKIWKLEKTSDQWKIDNIKVVGRKGLEPSHVAILVPKTNASTNSAIAPQI